MNEQHTPNPPIVKEGDRLSDWINRPNVTITQELYTLEGTWEEREICNIGISGDTIVDADVSFRDTEYFYATVRIRDSLFDSTIITITHA